MARKMPLHPGFVHVEDAIAKKGGYSKKEAGAILGARTRAASAAARAKNPRLNRAQGKQK